MRLATCAAAFLFVFLSAAHAAAAPITITTLIDSDANSATGCAVAGMAGVEQVIRVSADQQIVRTISRQSCVGHTLTPAVETNAGWP
ncbi:MAG TPA: hypothetical protein VFN10_06475, partial [Thermoanaerobaculia bacterium]|nr:hypothetical protein [Thermoanaerobaculia bacterium]